MSFDTDAAVILDASPSPSGERPREDAAVQGSPEIGGNFYVNEAFDECASSLSSLSGGICTNISDLRFGGYSSDGPSGAPSRDIETGEGFEVDDFCDREYRENAAATDIGSSMSSLTNDFVGRAHRFAAFGRLSKFQVQPPIPDDSFDAIENGEASPKAPPKRAFALQDGSPWYSVQTKHIQTGVCASPESSSDPSSQEAMVPLPDRDMVMSKKHLNELVKAPPPPSRSIWRSRRVSDLDSSRRSMTEYTRDTSAADGNFASYLWRSFDGSSRRRKWVIGFALVLFLICIVAIVGAALGTKQSGGPEEGSAFEVELPQEDAPYVPTDDHAYGPIDGLLEGSQTAEGEVPVDSSPPLNEAESNTSLDEDVEPWLAETEASSATSARPEVPDGPSSAIEESHAADSTPTAPEPVDELISEGATSLDPSTLEEPITTATSPDLSGLSNVDLASLLQTASQTQTQEPADASEAPEATLPAEPAEQGLAETGNQPLPEVSGEATVEDVPFPLVPATVASIVAPSTTTPDPSVISLRDIADTSIFKNRPDNSYDDDNYLTVKALEKASAFVMFDTSTLSRNRVERAVLRIYSIVADSFDEDGEAGGLSYVNVDLLPSASEWDGTTVTYSSPLQSYDSFSVGSFSVEEYPYHSGVLFNRLQRIHEIDVTRAFRHPNPAGSDVMTFMLSSNDGPTGRVDFASRELNNGFAQPELTLELPDTPFPTIFVPPKTSPPPSREPSPNPTPTPTKSSSPSLAPSSLCENKCDEGRTKRFEKEFGFDGSIIEWVDSCVATSLDCSEDAKKCEKECEKDAAKAEEKAWKKVDEHVLKCKSKCVEEAEANAIGWGAKADSAPFRPLAFMMMWDP